MAVRDDALVVPTVERARAAADVLAGEGVSLVLLFGSVAAGTAREGSDIDLVAVFDDIDYAERYPRRWRLEASCAAAAGVPVDVHVTDWPEWRHRTVGVSSSFEASVAAQPLGRTLFRRGPVAATVDWGKEIGMPASNLDEAAERLSDVRQALADMTAACGQRTGEVGIVDGRTEVDGSVREERLRSLCANASMAIEHALKAWCAASGVASERTHSVARLLGQASPLPGEVQDALGALEANTLRPSREAYDDVSCWRIGGTYPSALPQATLGSTQRLAGLLAAAAVASVGAVLGRLLGEGLDRSDERFAVCERRLRSAQAVLAAADPVTGEPRHDDASTTPQQRAAQAQQGP
ncbi:nucleotidyltransferase domain-containing protein [Candidatus Poriferisodalis sp.]|uniref:nucleotidyltransferase domain-containing protein n=1 Tax=Candidatus Poriferisodalis sp. TaxID=3101277 RepID=UPI003B0261CD